jgi:DNA-binding response OmpR family regulator
MRNDLPHGYDIAAAAASGPRQKQDQYRQAKGKLLIVGDCPDILRLLSLFFESKGYQVWIEVNALKVMSACKEHQPDVVLLDVNLPHVDINYMHGTLRTDQATRQIPLVFLTRGETDHLKLATSRLGIKDHTVRLPYMRELVNCVEAALSAASSHICPAPRNFSPCL